MRKIAMVLSGCGVNDGTEIHEAVSMMIALERAGFTVACFAPDMAQRDLVDHLAGRPAEGTRNVLVESARIARGKVAPLSSLDPASHDGLAFPGGFGAAKNLSDFAVNGSDMKVRPEVERAMAAFHAAGKPILAVCIAPALVAKVFGPKGCRFTIGDDEGTAEALASFGGTHVATAATGVCVDETLKIVTAPAYMLASGPAEVFAGITNAVERFAALLPR